MNNEMAITNPVPDQICVNVAEPNSLQAQMAELEKQNAEMEKILEAEDAEINEIRADIEKNLTFILKDDQEMKSLPVKKDDQANKR